MVQRKQIKLMFSKTFWITIQPFHGFDINSNMCYPPFFKVRQLRHEQHIRHLSKELDVTKSALEQERKLRSLQMDAIKVLWKEVQLMDVHQHAAGGPRSGPRTIPSGQVSRLLGGPLFSLFSLTTLTLINEEPPKWAKFWGYPHVPNRRHGSKKFNTAQKGHQFLG